MDAPIEGPHPAALASFLAFSHRPWLLARQVVRTRRAGRRSRTEFEKAAELDPKSVDARHGLIEYYSQAPGFMGGSIEKAKEQAHEIEKIDPMRGHLDMASLLENKDKEIAAVEKEYAAAPDSTLA